MIFLNVNNASKSIFDNLLLDFKHLIVNYWWVITLFFLIVFIIKILDKVKVISLFKSGLKSNSIFVRIFMIVFVIFIFYAFIEYLI